MKSKFLLEWKSHSFARKSNKEKKNKRGRKPIRKEKDSG
jgi:hypothetical protein